MTRIWRGLLGVSLVVACEAAPRVEDGPPEPPTETEIAIAAPPQPVSLVDRAKQLLAHGGVRARGERSLSIVHQLGAAQLEQSSTEVADSMMDTVFYTANTLYEGLGGELDGVSQSFTSRGNIIATIKFTRETFDALNYDERMVHVGKLESAAWEAVAASELSEDEAKMRSDEAERDAYAEMLSVLPRDAVRIDRRYRP